MSIENFFAENKPGTEFSAWIRTRIKQESIPTSPISALAKLYRENGSQQIRALSSILGDGEGSTLTIPTNKIVFSRFNPEQLLSWGRNGLAIFFGCATPTIEASIKEGWLDMSKFWGFYDFAKGGTYLPEFPQRQVDNDILTIRQWGGLDQAVRSNPNYAVFLDQRGLDLLPQSLALVLRQAYQAYEPVVQQFKSDHLRLASSL